MIAETISRLAPGVVEACRNRARRSLEEVDAIAVHLPAMAAQRVEVVTLALLQAFVDGHDSAERQHRSCAACGTFFATWSCEKCGAVQP